LLRVSSHSCVAHDSDCQSGRQGAEPAAQP
jgi:hypothetical protein